MGDIQDSVSDHLKCPICFEIPRDKMFQCRNGHPFCEDCCKKFTQKVCPQCKDQIPKIPIRCMAVEQMLDGSGLKFPCQFQGTGCEAKLDRRDIGEHNSSCKYNFEKFGQLENVCGRFGFKNCSFKFNRGSIGEALDHFGVIHRMSQETALLPKQFRIQFEDFKKIFNSSEATVFTPIIFDQRWWGHHFIYFIVIRFNPYDKTLQFLPFYLTNGLWNGSKTGFPEYVEVTLGDANGIVRPQPLFNCEGKTLNDSNYFAVTLNGKMGFNEENPLPFYSDLNLKMGKNNPQLPEDVQHVTSQATFKPGDIITPFLLNQRWPPLIRQVCLDSGSKNLDQIGWIGWKGLEDYKQRFTPLFTFEGEHVLICRANINEKWLVGSLHLEMDMSLDSLEPAFFSAPFLVNPEGHFDLDENFEVLYAPPNSLEWVAWKDAKEMEAVPVHDDDRSLRICEWRVQRGRGLRPFHVIGGLEPDAEFSSGLDMYVLVVNEQGKEGQHKCDICGQANFDAHGLKRHTKRKHK